MTRVVGFPDGEGVAVLLDRAREDAEATEGDDIVRFRDQETGSGWTFAGRAVDGELEGESLQAVPTDDTFWLVWSVFKPDTDSIE